MQVAFQTDQISEKSSTVATRGGHSLGLLNSSSNFKTGQSSIQTHKSHNENYSNVRIYSPYLSPSSVVVMDKYLRQAGADPTYVHNEARTKYFNISKAAKPSDHLKLNLMA
tara:strand:- start:465 stop:797 length:333 start_codon:yes stop_codon:yes gene_type:complete